MASRRSGWFLHRLETFKTDVLPRPNAESTTIRSYDRTRGVKTTVMKTLVLLSEANKGLSYKSKLTNNAVFTLNSNFIVNPLFPEGFNQTLWSNIYLIKSLVARTYRSRCTAKCKPSRGQRRWSHANTVTRCNLFLNAHVIAYKKDLYNISVQKKFKWTKLHELRQKAKLKKKTPKKKWTKFKKVGERRLKMNKKKKTPWQ
jgi:hypothetical protein